MLQQTALKIAYVVQNAGLNVESDVGAAHLIKTTCRVLKQAGHDVRLFSIARHSVMLFDNMDDLYSRERVSPGVVGSKAYIALERAIRRLQNALHLPYVAVFDSYRFYATARHFLPQFDLCHEYQGLFSVGTAVACARLGIPYILTSDADLLLEREVIGDPLRGVQGWLARREIEYAYRVAHKIICVSEPARQRLLTTWHVPPAKIEVIPNGVNIELFTQAQETAVLRQQLALGSAPVVMFVGGFQPWHGLDLLLDSFALVRQQLPETRLILVGDGPVRPAIEQKAADMGLASSLHITGFLEHFEVPQWLALADVVTIPYPKLPQELWFSPLKLFEYMAAGKAIVASRSGQIADVLVDGFNGRLVPPGEPAVLSQTILELLQAPEERTRLGQNARQQAIAQHSWAHYGQKLETVYQQVLKEASHA